jgi:hypothetical protein
MGSRWRIGGVAVLAPLLLVVLAVGLTWQDWRGHYYWGVDSVFYEAQTLELRGADADQARRQAIVTYANSGVPEHALEPFRNEQWVAASAQNYRRRWTVPALAAAVWPAFGERSLLLVSLAGYVAAGLAIFALLRQRFGRVPSVTAAAAILLLPPFRQWADYPLTDSWGVAIEALALLAAVLVVDRGRRWLPLWFGSMLLLSLTRDATLVVLAAVAWLALRERSRRALGLLVVGALAAAPVPLHFGPPFRVALAYDLNGSWPASHPTWSFVLDHYWKPLRWQAWWDYHTHLDPPNTRVLSTIFLLGVVLLLARRSRGELARERRLAGLIGVAFGLLTLALGQSRFGAGPELPTGVLVLGSLAAMQLARTGEEPFARLARSAGIASLLYLFLIPNYTQFRLELVTLVPVAIGLAYTVSAALGAAQATSGQAPQTQPATSRRPVTGCSSA